MKRHIVNAGFGVADYLSYPLGMLLVAPVVLHRIGAAEYGLWMIATSIVSAGSIIASGFGDACVQRIAQLRGTHEHTAISNAAKSMLAINVVFGGIIGSATWIVAPYAGSQIAASHGVTPSQCTIVIRVASILILIRAVESVAVGVQRAFEQYRSTVSISTIVRLLTLTCAAVLASIGRGTVSILLSTGFVMLPGAILQLRRASGLLSGTALWPSFQSGEMRILLSRGVFAWLQTLGGIVFGQLDRILLGIYLGAVTVAPYALCIQFSHPIYGLTGSALNFFFPYFSTRVHTEGNGALRRILLKAFAANAVLVAIPTALLLLFGYRILLMWAGPEVASAAAGILQPIVLGAALVGLSVTGAYAVQALGYFKTAAYINLTGRALMLFPMIALLHSKGIAGLAISRLLFGAVSLLIYIPLLQQQRSYRSADMQMRRVIIARELEEGAKP